MSEVSNICVTRTRRQGVYGQVKSLIEGLCLSMEYIEFLHGNYTDVNQQGNSLCFPLAFLLPMNSNGVQTPNYLSESFQIAIEFIDLDEINGSSEVSQTEIVDDMRCYASEFLARLQKVCDDENRADFESVSITPMFRVPTNNYITTGVRLDLTLKVAPDFTYCYEPSC